MQSTLVHELNPYARPSAVSPSRSMRVEGEAINYRFTIPGVDPVLAELIRALLRSDLPDHVKWRLVTRYASHYVASATHEEDVTAKRFALLDYYCRIAAALQLEHSGESALAERVLSLPALTGWDVVEGAAGELAAICNQLEHRLDQEPNRGDDAQPFSKAPDGWTLRAAIALATLDGAHDAITHRQEEGGLLNVAAADLQSAIVSALNIGWHAQRMLTVVDANNAHAAMREVATAFGPVFCKLLEIEPQEDVVAMLAVDVESFDGAKVRP